jgi:hypothetical protein
MAGKKKMNQISFDVQNGPKETSSADTFIRYIPRSFARGAKTWSVSIAMVYCKEWCLEWK